MPRKNVSKQIEKILDKADKNNFNSVAEEKISNILAVEKKQFVDSGKLLYINESGTITTSTIKVDKIEFIKNLISPIKTQLKDLTLYDISTYIKGKTISEKYYNFKNINKIYKELSTELKHNRRTNEISDGNQNKFIVNGVYDGDIFIEGKLRNSESIFVHNTYTSLDTNTYEAHIMRLTRKPPFPNDTTDMIVWYKFRNDINDSSENNNDLQAYLKTDAPADTGDIPKYLIKDGYGDYIVFNNDYAVVVPRPLNDPMYYFQPNMTISFWLYKPTLTSYETIVMNRESHYMGILSENLYGGWSIFTENKNILVRITTEDNKNNVPYHWIGSNVIQEATWQYVTIVFEHVTDDPNVKNNIHLYIDGQHFNTLSFNSEYVQFQSDSIDTAPLALGTVFYGFNGNTAPGGTYTFSSSQNTGIYDFRMYDRILTEEEINKLYIYVPPKEIEIIQYPKISFTSKSSSNISNYGSNRAFDGQTTGIFIWISSSPVYTDGQYSPTGTYYLDPDYRGEYIIIDLGEETIINQMKMYGRNGADAQRHPRNYRIYGSNDQNDYNNPQNGNWEQIFEKINDTPDTVPSSYPTVDEFFDNFTTYRYYALVTNKVYSGNQYVELLEWELFHVKIPGNDPPSLPLVLKYPPAPLPTNNHNHLSTERFSTTTLEGQEYGNGEYIVSWSTHSTDHYRSTTPGVFSDEPATGGYAHAWQAYQYYQTQYKTELGNGLSDVLGDWLRLKLPIKLKLSYIEFYITENEKYKQPAYTVFGTNDNGVTWKNILEVSILDIYGADGTGGTYPVTLDEPGLYADTDLTRYRKHISPIINDTELFNEYGIVFTETLWTTTRIAFNDIAFYGTEDTGGEENQVIDALLRINQGNVKNIIDASVGPTDVFSVSHIGNLGIKTKYPTEKLDVRGSINVSGNINDITSTEIGYMSNTTDNVQYQLDLINKTIEENNESMNSHVINTDLETSNYIIQDMIDKTIYNKNSVKENIENLIDNVANVKQDNFTTHNGIYFNSNNNFIELVQESEWDTNTVDDYINYGSVQLHRDSIKINNKNVLFSDNISGKQDIISDAIINSTLYQDLAPSKMLHISQDFKHPLINGLNTQIKKIQDENEFYTIFTDTSTITFDKEIYVDMLLIGGGNTSDSGGVIYNKGSVFSPGKYFINVGKGTGGDISTSSSIYFKNKPFAKTFGSDNTDGNLLPDGGISEINDISIANILSQPIATITNNQDDSTYNYGAIGNNGIVILKWFQGTPIPEYSYYDRLLKYPYYIWNNDSNTNYDSYLDTTITIKESSYNHNYGAFNLFKGSGIENDLRPNDLSKRIYHSASNTYNSSDGFGINEYRTNYKGEFVLIDLGKEIYLDNYKMQHREVLSTIGSTALPVSWRIYASNNNDVFQEINVTLNGNDVNTKTVANHESWVLLDEKENSADLWIESEQYNQYNSGTFQYRKNLNVKLDSKQILSYRYFMVIFNKIEANKNKNFILDTLNLFGNTEYKILSNSDAFIDNTDDLLVWYKFDNNLSDSSVNKIDLIPWVTNSTNQYAIPQYNNSIVEKGTHSIYLDGLIRLQANNLDNNPNFYTPEQMTLSVWFKGGSLQPYKQTLASAKGGVHKGWAIYFISDPSDGSANIIRFDYGNENYTDNYGIFDFSAKTKADTWYHLVFVFDRNRKSETDITKIPIDLYVDGVKNSTIEIKDDFGTSQKDFGATNLLISSTNNWKTTDFRLKQFYIDDFRLYNRVLTHNEILELFNYNHDSIITKINGVEVITQFSFGDDPTDMVAWYKFEDDFRDSSYNGHDLTPNVGVPKFTDNSKYGTKSVWFEGNTQWNSTPNKAGLFLDNLSNRLSTHIDNSITISFWVYTLGKGQINYGHIFSGITSNNYGGDEEFKILYKNNTEKLGFVSNDNYENFIDVTSDGGEPFLNRWVHIVWILDGTNTSIYIDGEKKVDKTDYIFPTITDTYTFTIGAWNVNNPDVGGARDINGYLDDFRIYKRALTPGEIDILYNYVPNLVTETTQTTQTTNEPAFGDDTTDMYAWYKFNNNFTDSSGNNNNAIGFNSPTFDDNLKKVGTHAVSFVGGPGGSDSQYLTVPQTDFSLWDGFTVSCWVYFEDNNASNGRIIDFGDGQADNNIYMSRSDTTNKIRLSISDGSTNTESDTVNDVIVNNTWMHVAWAISKGLHTERMYPPVRNLASNSHTISGESYGNGLYETSSSTAYQPYGSHTGFNTDNDIGFHGGEKQYSNGTYSSGNYIVNDYYGDWLKIKLPVAINLTKYGFSKRPIGDGGYFSDTAPAQYKIYGSNDNSNWTELVHKSSSISFPDAEYYESIATNGFYQYFVLVVNKILGNSHILNFDEWYIYGTEGEYTEWKLYVNGTSEELSSSNSIYPVSTTYDNCYIAKSNWSSDEYFKGKLDDLRIYNRALTEQEITDLYNYVPSTNDEETNLVNVISTTDISSEKLENLSGLTANVNDQIDELINITDNVSNYLSNITEQHVINMSNYISDIYNEFESNFELKQDKLIFGSNITYNEETNTVSITPSDDSINTIYNVFTDYWKSPLPETKFYNDLSDVYSWFKFDSNLDDHQNNLVVTTSETESKIPTIDTSLKKQGSGSLNFNVQYLKMNGTNSFSNGLSLCFWIYLGSYSTTSLWVLKLDLGNNMYVQFYRSNISNNQDTVQVKFDFTKNYQIIGLLERENWVHITIVIGKTQGLKLYKNNQIIINDDKTFTRVDDNFTILLGARNDLNVNDNNFIGNYDDFRIYSKELTEDEIFMIYKSYEDAIYDDTPSLISSQHFSSSLITNFNDDLTPQTWYKFDGTNGILDSSGNSNDATAIGTPVLSEKSISISKDNYLKLPDNIIDHSKDITIAFWYRFDGQYDYINAKMFDFSVNNNTNNNDSSIKVGRVLTHPSYLEFIIDSHVATNIRFDHVRNGNLTHLTWIIKKDGTWIIYQNGDIIYSQTHIYPSPQTYSHSYLGKSNYLNEFNTDNNITLEDFRLYNRALHEQEIQSIYKNNYDNPILPKILAWYKFDDNFNDSSVNQNHLTGGDGLTFSTENQVGTSCVEFPSRSTSNTLYGDVDLSQNTSFTISFWVLRKELNGGDIILSTTGDVTNNLQIKLSTSGNLLFQFNGSYINTPINYQTWNEWTFYTVTYDSINRKRSIYINSVLSKSNSITTPTNFEPQIRIGSDGASFFRGKIDDLRIYNYVLSTTGIKQLYNQGKITDLLVWYQFEGNKNDSSGNNYHMNSNGTFEYITDSRQGSQSIQSKTVGAYMQHTITESSNGNNGFIGRNYNSKTITFAFWTNQYYNSNVANYLSTATYSIYVDKDNVDTLIFKINSEIFSIKNAIPGTASLKIWTHICFTLNKNRECLCYINGKLVQTQVMGDFETSSENKLELFKTFQGDNPNNPMDDIRIWNRALSYDEVLSVYTNTYKSPSSNWITKDVGQELIFKNFKKYPIESNNNYRIYGSNDKLAFQFAFEYGKFNTGWHFIYDSKNIIKKQWLDSQMSVIIEDININFISITNEGTYVSLNSDIIDQNILNYEVDLPIDANLKLISNGEVIKEMMISKNTKYHIRQIDNIWYMYDFNKEIFSTTTNDLTLYWDYLSFIPYRYFLAIEDSFEQSTQIELLYQKPKLLTWNGENNTSVLNINTDLNVIYTQDNTGKYNKLLTSDYYTGPTKPYVFLNGLNYNKTTNELTKSTSWINNTDYISHKNIKVFDNKIEIGNQGSFESKNTFTANIHNYSHHIQIGDNITVHQDDNTYCFKANDNIWLDGADITYTSDERIKKNIQDIDDDSALDKIMTIEPKTYRYIDSINKGDNEVYGFISQQIKEVLPEATDETKRFVPNIYQKCKCNDNIVYLPNDLDISQLVSTYNGSNPSSIVRLIDKNFKNIDVSFTTYKDDNDQYLTIDYLLPKDVKDIFVYGTFVDDLTTINKSYIYTLNVCATQVVSRKINNLRSVNDTLKNKSSNIEQRLDELEQKISNF